MTVTQYTVDRHKARSLAELQTIARNQMRRRAGQLRERAESIEIAIDQVNGVTDWESYEKLADLIEDDVADFNALAELGEFYGEMKKGEYF